MNKEFPVWACCVGKGGNISHPEHRYVGREQAGVVGGGGGGVANI
jgi:hypothetical protein